MVTSGPVALSRSLRWEIWWRWTLFSLIGITVANVIYDMLPHALRYPQADENIWLEESWRVAALTCAYYTPVSLAQWLVLRRYVHQSWWWLLITLGSVVIVYPGSIWVLYALGQWEPAGWVWLLGMGGITVYVVAQWVALRRWTRNTWILGMWMIVAAGGILVMLNVIEMVNLDITKRMSNAGFLNILYRIAVSALYQMTLGGVLTVILRPDVPSEGTTEPLPIS